MSAAKVHRLSRPTRRSLLTSVERVRLSAIVPSLGWAADDLEDLGDRLSDVGYTAAGINPRGLNGDGLDQPLSLRGLAADTADAIESL